MISRHKVNYRLKDRSLIIIINFPSWGNVKPDAWSAELHGITGNISLKRRQSI